MSLLQAVLLCLVCIFLSPTALTQTDENISDNCLCDLTETRCDINCFCDPDCSEEDRSVFDEPNIVRINEEVSCVRKELVLTDNSEYEVTETTDSNLFCLWKDNYAERNFFRTVPTVSTANQFDSYVNQYSRQVIAVNSPTSNPASVPYRYGSDIYAVRQNGSLVGTLSTIGPGLFSRTCVDVNQIKYLTEWSKECEVIVAESDLENTCSNPDSGWSLNNFITGFKVVQDTQFFSQVDLNDSATISSVYDSSSNLTSVFVRCIRITPDSECDEALNSVTGDISLYLDTLFDDATDTCNNIVKDVTYKVVYSGSLIGQVAVDVTLQTLSLDPTAVTSQPLTLSRNIEVLFLNALNETGTKRSGNPGFQRGLEIRKGVVVVTTDPVTDETETSVVVNEQDPYLSITSPAAQCGVGTSTVDVRFGYNTVSGCHVTVSRANLSESQAACEAIQDQLTQGLWTLSDEVVLAQFGNTDSSLPGDWVSIKPTTTAETGSFVSGGCRLATTYKLIIFFANVGQLKSPQAKIVGARRETYSADYSFNCGLQCSGEGLTMDIHGQVIVNFVDVSEDTQGAVRKIPPIETDIPYDFFYPFLVNTAPRHFYSLCHSLPAVTSLALIFHKCVL